MSGFIGDVMASILGNGLPGAQSKGGLLGGGGGPTGGSGMVGSSARGRTRHVLREAFGNSKLLQNMLSPTCAVSNECAALKPSQTRLSIITPFRAAMSAGDIAGTVNSAPRADLPGSNQINAKTPMRFYWGGAHNDGQALYSGNPRYVYDSSNYIRFKRLQAQNRNYNDRSFGGDQSNASQVPLAAVRHG